jgi:hypothetical protein
MVAGFAHMIEEKDTLVAKSLQPSELFSAAL